MPKINQLVGGFLLSSYFYITINYFDESKEVRLDKMHTDEFTYYLIDFKSKSIEILKDDVVSTNKEDISEFATNFDEVLNGEKILVMGKLYGVFEEKITIHPIV